MRMNFRCKQQQRHCPTLGRPSCRGHALSSRPGSRNLALKPASCSVLSPASIQKRRWKPGLHTTCSLIGCAYSGKGQETAILNPNPSYDWQLMPCLVRVQRLQLSHTHSYFCPLPLIRLSPISAFLCHQSYTIFCHTSQQHFTYSSTFAGVRIAQW